MSSRVVMVNDLLAFIDGAKQWLENQLADGAGTKTTTFGTSAGAADGSDRASVAATPTPPSAGTTASGVGSVAAAVEALRVALAENMGVYLAAKQLLALDVPGRIAKAEADAAKLREQLAEAGKDAHYAAVKHEEEVDRLRDDLADAQASAKTWESNFHEMAANADRAHEALRVEREACDAERDMRRSAEAVINAVSDDLELLTDNRVTLAWCRGNWKEKRDAYRKAQEEHDARREREKQNNGAAHTRQDNGDQQCQPKTHATADTSTNSADGITSANTAEPSSTRVSTTTDPLQVTDEDRREAAIAVWGRLNQSMRGQAVEDVARLIAKVRHERDGVVRELVEGLRKFIAPNEVIKDWGDGEQPIVRYSDFRWYYGFTVGDLRNADALVNKHGGAA